MTYSRTEHNMKHYSCITVAIWYHYLYIEHFDKIKLKYTVTNSISYLLCPRNTKNEVLMLKYFFYMGGTIEHWDILSGICQFYYNEYDTQHETQFNTA